MWSLTSAWPQWPPSGQMISDYWILLDGEETAVWFRDSRRKTEACVSGLDGLLRDYYYSVTMIFIRRGARWSNVEWFRPTSWLVSCKSSPSGEPSWTYALSLFLSWVLFWSWRRCFAVFFFRPRCRSELSLSSVSSNFTARSIRFFSKNTESTQREQLIIQRNNRTGCFTLLKDWVKLILFYLEGIITTNPCLQNGTLGLQMKSKLLINGAITQSILKY